AASTAASTTGVVAEPEPEPVSELDPEPEPTSDPEPEPGLGPDGVPLHATTVVSESAASVTMIFFICGKIRQDLACVKARAPGGAWRTQPRSRSPRSARAPRRSRSRGARSLPACPRVPPGASSRRPSD